MISSHHGVYRTRPFPQDALPPHHSWLSRTVTRCTTISHPRHESQHPLTDAIGEAHGIIGPESAVPATLAPDISLRTSGGQVEIVWNNGKQEAVETQKDSGSGWQFFAMDTRPNYIAPLPTPTAMWKYRAIYTEDSQRVGQWSNVAEISVGGHRRTSVILPFNNSYNYPQFDTG